ncbi:MAG: MBL fold metallo-hydrolase [Bacteroidia bacterium]|jgi:hydroxyacylglutathione hydrolase
MLKQFCFNPFSENTYLVADAQGQAAIIDPGCYDAEEQAMLRSFITEKGLQPVMLINTHCHIDHVLGNHFVHQTYGLSPYIHRNDEADLERLVSYAPVFGIRADASPAPAGYLEHGESLRLGTLSFELRLAPGHSAGSLCLVNHHEKYVIAGDVLFAGSIGRTDLPGGDYETLLNSVRNQLFTLPGDYVVYPGHGPATTIYREQTSNPFFQ